MFSFRVWHLINGLGSWFVLLPAVRKGNWKPLGIAVWELSHYWGVYYALQTQVYFTGILQFVCINVISNNLRFGKALQSVIVELQGAIQRSPQDFFSISSTSEKWNSDLPLIQFQSAASRRLRMICPQISKHLRFNKTITLYCVWTGNVL